MTEPAAPSLDVEPIDISMGPPAGVLDIRWRVTNQSYAPIAILEAWLPHSGFFGERRALQPVPNVAAGETVVIRRTVRCLAEPGEVVENGFLILTVRFESRTWRVLTRVRVERSTSGLVTVGVEAITAQVVGFAHAPSPTGPASAQARSVREGE